MKYINNVFALSAVSCLLLVGCGGGTDSTDTDNEADQVNTITENGSNTNDDVLIGIFVDSAVEGISFSTATQSGMTNSAGEFSYLAGEQVVFSIGETQFPAVTAAAQVSPVDIAASSENPIAMTTNIARLLQSLDQDGNPDNGITISSGAADSAALINFDVSTDEFSSNTDVINLVANSGSSNSVLISVEAANSHLDETLGVTSNQNNRLGALEVSDDRREIRITTSAGIASISIGSLAVGQFREATDVVIILTSTSDYLEVDNGLITPAVGSCISTSIDLSNAKYSNVAFEFPYETTLEDVEPDLKEASLDIVGSIAFTSSEIFSFRDTPDGETQEAEFDLDEFYGVSRNTGVICFESQTVVNFSSINYVLTNGSNVIMRGIN